MRLYISYICLVALIPMSAEGRSYPETEWKARFPQRPFPIIPDGLVLGT